MRNVIYNFRNSQKFQLERKRTFFFLSGFPFTDTDDSQDSKGREGTFWDLFLFYSTTSTRSRALRHLLATLHVTWLSHIFNRNACVYQTATRWDLPPYRITIWLIDWWCNVCLFTWWIDSMFLLQRFDIGNRWIWTRIDYHPCITSKPTKNFKLSYNAIMDTFARRN